MNNLTDISFHDNFYLDPRAQTNDKAELYESVKLLVIVIIDFKRYPNTYCLCQVDVAFVPTFKIWQNTSKLESQPLMQQTYTTHSTKI